MLGFLNRKKKPEPENEQLEKGQEAQPPEKKKRKTFKKRFFSLLSFLLVVLMVAGLCYYLVVKKKITLTQIPVAGKYLTPKGESEKLSPEAQLLVEQGNLKIKERDLNKRAKALDERKAILDQKELDLKRKMQKPVDGTTMNPVMNGAENEEKTNKSEKKMIKIYGEMDAKKAALVLDKLDDETAIAILTGMKPDQAGEIVGNLPTAKAAIISQKMLNP